MRISSKRLKQKRYISYNKSTWKIFKIESDKHKLWCRSWIYASKWKSQHSRKEIEL